VNLGDDRREPGAPEGFLEDPERFAGLLDADSDEPSGIETEAQQAWAIGNACLAGGAHLVHPEKRAPVVASDARSKGRGETVRGAGGACLGAANLMQRAERQSATENPVERSKAKGEKAGDLSGRPRG
jgi:hypothetical protein